MYATVRKGRLVSKEGIDKKMPAVNSDNTDELVAYLSIRMTQEISRDVRKLTDEMIRNIMEDLIGGRKK